MDGMGLGRDRTGQDGRMTRHARDTDGMRVQDIDVDNSGTVSKDELYKYMRTKNLPDNEIEVRPRPAPARPAGNCPPSPLPFLKPQTLALDKAEPHELFSTGYLAACSQGLFRQLDLDSDGIISFVCATFASVHYFRSVFGSLISRVRVELPHIHTHSLSLSLSL